jgi:hypothetical protein
MEKMAWSTDGEGQDGSEEREETLSVSAAIGEGDTGCEGLPPQENARNNKMINKIFIFRNIQKEKTFSLF